MLGKFLAVGALTVAAQNNPEDYNDISFGTPEAIEAESFKNRELDQAQCAEARR
jgi:hypothetical protein